MSDDTGTTATAWPSLPLEAWADSCATLHRWTQIVGKIRLVQTPWVNHSWHVTLYVTARGLGSSPIPYGARAFEIEFDFLAHALRIQTSDGRCARLPLRAQSVSAFYREVMRAMASLDLVVPIHKRPNELPDALPFDEDEMHKAYDPEYVQRFWRILVHADRVLKGFRARFIGKCSPVHFFWGAADLAVTRFSGRRAPPHPGGVPHLPDRVAREAYSHEVSSCGFWPGGSGIEYPAFYSYAYPEPQGYAQAALRPADAFYSPVLREFILPYEAVRQSASPDAMLGEFLQSTYDAAASLGHWDAELEREADPFSSVRMAAAPGFTPG
jgi:hypothetical protein